MSALCLAVPTGKDGAVAAIEDSTAIMASRSGPLYQSRYFGMPEMYVL